MKLNNFRGELTDISAKKEPLTTACRKMMSRCWQEQRICNPSFRSKCLNVWCECHFWLFSLVRAADYILYTYLIYHAYTLGIHTTIYIFSGPRAIMAARQQLWYTWYNMAGAHMFPGCMSPCTKPCTYVISANAWRSKSPTSIGDIPTALSPATSSTFMSQPVLARGSKDEHFNEGLILHVLFLFPSLTWLTWFMIWWHQ